jgi:catechol 2,3-dioxygenase-like lactoylglutathione lyase family enzyme
MTQIRHMAGTVNRRPGELGVHSLDHFVLQVPDVAQAEKFYGTFGLDLREESNALHVYASASQHRWGSVVEGPHKKMHHISYGVFEDDMPRFRERLDKLRIEQLDPPPGFESNGIWFRDHDGNLVELRVAEKSSPNDKSVTANVSSAAGVAGAPSRSAVPMVRPRRLAHILIFTRDVMKAIKFYGDVLGMRLSDRSGEIIAFMHGIHGSDHHMIAFAKSDAPGMHHTSWDVSSINEIGLGALQMAGKGYSAGWGLGRHVLGSNYFHYVRDPWGSYAEYSSDIDYIPVTHDWESGDHPIEDSFYVWGPEPPPDFAHNYEGAR